MQKPVATLYHDALCIIMMLQWPNLPFLQREPSLCPHSFVHDYACKLNLTGAGNNPESRTSPPFPSELRYLPWYGMVPSQNKVKSCAL